MATVDRDIGVKGLMNVGRGSLSCIRVRRRQCFFTYDMELLMWFSPFCYIPASLSSEFTPI